MPIYEYTCRDCGNVYESIEKIGTNEVRCECGGNASKTMGSYLSSVHGLPNGHIGARVKK